MSWSGFLAERERRRRLADDPSALPALLAGWRFADQPEMLAAAAAALADAAPEPPAHRLALAALPGAALPPQPDGPARLIRQRLASWAARQPLPAPALSPDRWALLELAALGSAVEQEVRGAWRDQRYRVDPAADSGARDLWQLWSPGGPALWAARADWEDRYLDAAAGAFLQVLTSRELPPDRRRQALADLREGYWFQLLGGGEGAPGWAELAARVLETAPPGPVDALVGGMGSAGRLVAGRCVARRGYWPGTLERLMPDTPRRAARGLRAAGLVEASAARAEALLDLHTVIRLLAGWSRPGGSSLERDWQVIRQNRGRSRGRLRALVAASPGRALRALAPLDGLHERTLAATRRWAWDWGWEALSRGLELDFTRPVSPPCRLDADDGLTPIGPAERAAAETWILLVVLKGRLEHLRRWSREGGTGDRDGTWGRLLNDELPGCLRDRGGGYHRLRAWLADGLEGALAGWALTLAAVAALPGGRGLKRGASELLAPRWDPRVRLPSAGFPTFVRNARAALALLESASDPGMPDGEDHATR